MPWSKHHPQFVFPKDERPFLEIEIDSEFRRLKLERIALRQAHFSYQFLLQAGSAYFDALAGERRGSFEVIRMRMSANDHANPVRVEPVPLDAAQKAVNPMQMPRIYEARGFSIDKDAVAVVFMLIGPLVKIKVI
jgi:hypothetical protein